MGQCSFLVECQKDWQSCLASLASLEKSLSLTKCMPSWEGPIDKYCSFQGMIQLCKDCELLAIFHINLFAEVAETSRHSEIQYHRKMEFILRVALLNAHLAHIHSVRGYLNLAEYRMHIGPTSPEHISRMLRHEFPCRVARPVQNEDIY